MRTRLLVGLLILIASGAVAAQSSPAAPSTAETPTSQQPPTERQPTDAAGGDAAAAGSQSSPSQQSSAPIAAPTATQGEPTGAPTATTSPNADPTAQPSTPIAETGPVHAGDPVAGEQKASVCGACHGIDGNSADPQYPKLAGQNELYIARQLMLYKTGERPNPIMQGMAAPLSAQDMRDLGAFYATKPAQAGLASDAKIAGTEISWAERGEQLYRGGNSQNGTPACMACHGPSGRGNPGSRYPALAGQHANYTKLQLEAFRAGEIHGDGENANAIMAGVASQLSDEDIEALATYIEGLHRRPVVDATSAVAQRSQTTPAAPPPGTEAAPTEAQTVPSSGTPR